jgi:NAD-dependent SIR2 family protein deacetylase
MAVIFDPLRGRVRPVASHPDETIIDVLTDRYTASDWAVLTGAGMSTDSGVPDYRGPDAAPRSPMTIQTFLSHPDQRARYWARSWIGWPRMRSTRPNPGHLGLAGLDVAGIVTQNVDGLHQAAAKERSSRPGAPARARSSISTAASTG